MPVAVQSRLVSGFTTCLACLTLLSAKPSPPSTPPEVYVTSQLWTLPPLQLGAQNNLVQTDVTVRDFRGDPIPGLLKSNFIMEEDGKTEPLTYFSAISSHGAKTMPAQPEAHSPNSPGPPEIGDAPPRYIALFFDDVHTSSADLMIARNAALRMIHAGLGPNDHVCIFTASGTQALDCTGDEAGLKRAVDRISIHPATDELSTPCPPLTGYEAAQVALHNNTLILNAVVPGYTLGDAEMLKADAWAIWEQERNATSEILSSLQRATDYLAHRLGQRILLLTSDGFLDDDLGDAVQAVIQRALRDDIVINSLDTKGLFTQAAGQPANTNGVDCLKGPASNAQVVFEEEMRLPDEQDHEDALASLAEGTGGYFFHNSNDLKLGFQQLAATPPIVYQLGFSLDVPHNGAYHKLKVRLTPPIRGVIVQARPGYFAPPPGITLGDFLAAMDNAMRDTDVRSNVPALLTVKPLHEEVTITAKFNVARLPFIRHLGREDQKLFVTAALFDKNGNLAAGKRGELDLWLLPATRQRFNDEGLQAQLTLYTAAPGTYRLRVVVGESSDAELTSFSQILRVH